MRPWCAARIDTTMPIRRGLCPRARPPGCVLTVRYLETTLFASLIRHVVRCVYIFVNGGGGEETVERMEEARGWRGGEKGRVDRRAMYTSPPAHTGARTCMLDIDPDTWPHRSRQTPWITAGTLQDYLSPLPYCSRIGETRSQHPRPTVAPQDLLSKLVHFVIHSG